MSSIMFTKAIVRRPARSLIKGLSAHPELGVPDYVLAQRQHDAYIAALERCGLKLEVLPAWEEYPDSCFVEDVAVCARNFALITRPGAASRAGETEGIADILSAHYKIIERIEAPGTLEGGDVMMVANSFYIGLSARTNAEGAAQFVRLLDRHGLNGHTVKMPPTLHLKTGMSYMEDGILLVDRAFSEHEEFNGFSWIDIAPEESYAANCLRINDYVIVPAGYPKTLAALQERGLKTIALDMSEYRKIDGGLSCLSLRF